MSVNTIATWEIGYATPEQLDLLGQQIAIYVSDGWTDGQASISQDSQGRNVAQRTWDTLEHAQSFKIWMESTFSGFVTLTIAA
jgi:hypothetical protein